MPTVVREGVKSRQNGQKVGNFQDGANISPEPGSDKEAQKVNEGDKNGEKDSASEAGNITNTLNKPEEGVYLVSRCSGESGLGIVPNGDEHDKTPERVSGSKELVPVDTEKRIVERNDAENNDQEQRDIVPALPEGWPEFKNKLWRRRSCELVKSTSSCVRKAVSHLHFLQNLLETYYKPTSSEEKYRENLSRESKLKSRSETTATARSFSRGEDESRLRSATLDDAESIEGYSSRGNKLRWLLSSDSLGDYSKEDDLDRMLESSASGAVLEVRGTSAGTALAKSLTPKSSSAKTDKPEEAETGLEQDIVDEVLTLLGRLETDRVNTEQKLQKERERVQQLGKSIDQLAYKRMQELPVCVQREHEACAIDINELRWHCAYTGRVEARLSERLRQAESKHAKLLQDLENMQKHCPLVEEKLDLEGEAMSSIQNKQDETDDELRSTLERLQATEMKTAAAQGKASQERILIKQDVDVVRNELNAVSDDLAQLKMYFTSNTHTKHDIRNTLKENAELLVQLERREERIKVLEATQQDKVMRLREKIVEQEAEQHKLIEENNELRTEKEIMKATLQTDISKLEYRKSNGTSRIKDLNKRNKESKGDILETKKKIDVSTKQHASDDKTIHRAKLEMEKVRDQLMVSREETSKIATVHTSLSETYILLKEETMTVEESLKTTAEALRKQLKDEAHARTVLQARIAADGADLVKTTQDSTKKREKATVRADEIDKLVNHVKEQVSKLEKIHNERLHTISELDKILGKVAIQHNDMETRLKKEITDLNPKEEDFKKENMDLTKKIDHMTWKTEMMDKKMQDMASSSTMMNKAIGTTSETINDLNEELTELNIQLETGSETEQDLKSSLSQAEERTIRAKEDHEQHMVQRQLVLENNQRGVQTSLEENKLLAVKYQRTQKEYLNTKAALMREFEKRVYDEDSLKDHRQLTVLQTRMHEALQYYYRLRGLETRAGIATFELESARNGDKLIWLQTEMMKVIENISRFLEANNAAHEVISFEAAKIAETPPGRKLVS